MEYSRDDDVQIIVPDETPKPSRAVAKKSTSRPSMSKQEVVQQTHQKMPQQSSVPFLPQVTPNNVSVTGPPSKIVVSWIFLWLIYI